MLLDLIKEEYIAYNKFTLQALPSLLEVHNINQSHTSLFLALCLLLFIKSQIQDLIPKSSAMIKYLIIFLIYLGIYGLV